MKRKTNKQHRPDSAKRKQARAESSSAPIIREGVDLTQLEMAPGQSAHLSGSAVLEVTAGCLAVYGALLTPHSGPVTIHAPTKFGRAVQLAAVAAATADVEPPCQPLQSAVQAVLQPLAAAELNDNNTPKQQQQQQQQQKGYAVIDAAAATTAGIAGGGGGGGGEGGSGLPAWQVPPPWSQAVGDLVAAAAAASGHGPSSSSSSPGSSLVPLAVAVTGSKGCGKSAFARLLVNALLTRQQGGSDGVVAYLDLDPGQPEFTPPGLVSLQLLRRPVFGPPHMQHQQPLLSYFQGDTSSQSEPGRYLQAVQALVYRYTQISAADLAANISTTVTSATAAHDAGGGDGGRLPVLPPLVINTPGWITGLGLDLLAEVLRCAQPTHVVQLQTPNPKKNLPAAAWWLDGSLSATAAAAAAAAGGGGGGSGAAAGGGGSSMVLPVVLQVPSVSGAAGAGDAPSSAAGGGGAGCDSMMSAAPSGDTTQTAGGKGGGSSVKGVSAAAVRNLMWLSWAERVAAQNSNNPASADEQSSGRGAAAAAAGGGAGGGFAAAEDFAGAAAALAAAVPMVVSLADVAVELLHAQVAPSELPVALNGAVVGLAVAGGAAGGGSGVSAAPQQQQPQQQQLCECLGLGLVRAVDGPAGELYLLTDLSEQQLQRVDMLQVGRLELPDKLLECRGFASPYQGLFCLSSTATGAGQIKSRNNLLRASQLLR